MNHTGLIGILFKYFPDAAVGVFFLPGRFKQVNRPFFLHTIGMKINCQKQWRGIATASGS
jgi:hypothetical protein